MFTLSLKVASILLIVVDTSDEPFLGVLSVSFGVGSGNTVMDTSGYIALSLMTIDYLEGETIISRKASGRSISYIARVLVYLTERAMVWLWRCYYFSRQRVACIII